MDMCGEYQAARRKKIILISSAAIIVVLMLWCGIRRVTKLKADLCRVKEEMENMKGSGGRCSPKKDPTDKKLEKIEKQLQEFKTTQEKKIDRCKSQDEMSEKITGLVKQALDEYSADKTGKTDFALESAGGSIVGTGCTQMFEPAPKTTTLFGIPLCQGRNGPRQILQANTMPGECWAFKGWTGTATVRLLGPVFIDGVTLEHISKSISPTQEIDTAPKDFSIWGLDVANDKSLLGQFVYDVNGPTLQYFPIQCSGDSYEYVDFKVHSNHGNPMFTCVYRLRVHGTLDTNRLQN